VTVSASDSIVIASDTVYEGATHGVVTIVDGGLLTVRGTHDGSIDVSVGGQLRVEGAVHGAVSIESLGAALVSGDISGPVDIKVAGTLLVERSGRISGDVTNFGSYTNRGLRVGVVDGREPNDEPGAVTAKSDHGAGPENYGLPQR